MIDEPFPMSVAGNAQAERELRNDVRAFLRQHVTPRMREQSDRFERATPAQLREWQSRLIERGWGAVNWPTAWGGTDWPVRRQFIFEEEMALGGAPDPLAFNFRMIGPILIRYGTAEQQRRFLPCTLTLDHWWCQGYSEPSSGSDLASLRTRARRDGDHYIVEGSKIWTSHAHEANWIFCLVRTDTEAAPQRGISFLLIDLSSPGVTLRPIRHFYGEHVFNQVFFDGVRVPVANRVGEEHGGWTVAKALLEHERLFVARHAEARRRLRRLVRVASLSHQGQAPIADARVRDRIGALSARVQALGHLVMRGFDALERDGSVGPFASTLKLSGIAINQALDDAIVDVLGPHALAADAAYDEPALMEHAGLIPQARHAMESRYRFRGPAIAGGSSEVQRNIIAKRVLGL